MPEKKKVDKETLYLIKVMYQQAMISLQGMAYEELFWNK